MSEALVKISSGWLEGKIEKDLNGKKFYSFEGIPYAVPPVGSLRFKAPVPVTSWKGVRKAWSKGPSSAFSFLIQEDTSEKPKHIAPELLQFYKMFGPTEPLTIKPLADEALQFTTHSPIIEETISIRRKILTGGSEDCLYLNVFTPSLPRNNSALKPVMVYIHGGGFICGSPHPYGPELIVSEDVILVTVCYRLGFLGFLSIDDPKLGATGNAGMKDIRLSLKWVQDNIAAFSGDKNNVTIIGLSAGGAAVDYLLLSPTTKGLFQRAILQSGCSLSYWAWGYKNRETIIAKHFGCSSTNNAELLRFLQNMPLDELLERAMLLDGPISPSTRRYNAPVVEHPDAKDAFLTENPIDILKSGNYQQVPLIFGYTSDEGIFFNLPILGFSFGESEVVPNFLDLEVGSEQYVKVAREILKFYQKDVDEFAEKGVVAENGKKLAGGIAINVPIFQRVKHHLKKNRNPVFIYRVSISTKLCSLTKGKYKGVTHTDDFGYLFLMPDTPEVTPGSIEDITRKRFVKLLTNFAKNGNPNPENPNEILTTTWEPISEERNMRLLDIGEELSMVDQPETEYVEFWEHIYKSNGCIDF